jgi:glycogen debranching enzyme
MAALKEMPFGRYCGSVDATLLFVLLAGAYYERTGDRAFVEYHRQSTDGLLHQGWKDSDDAIFHADGTLARGPIAPCEFQGYVYAAYGGVFIVLSRLWGWGVDHMAPDYLDVLGGIVSLARVAIMMWWPR